MNSIRLWLTLAALLPAAMLVQGCATAVNPIVAGLRPRPEGKVVADFYPGHAKAFVERMPEVSVQTPGTLCIPIHVDIDATHVKDGALVHSVRFVNGDFRSDPVYVRFRYLKARAAMTGLQCTPLSLLSSKVRANFFDVS